MTATRVLICDDNPQDRFLASRALAAELVDPSIAEVGDAAAFDRLLADFAFDAVVTDYQLRWSTGLQLLSAIRAAGSDAPVVMFTNTGNEEVAAAGLRAGLADYILKGPAEYGRLARAVRGAIERAAIVRREQEARSREREALLMAEAALRSKDEFLSMLSHELRTPLNTIAGWVQMLQADRTPERVERGLLVIDRNTSALARLVDDLVDVSRIVTGQMRLQVQPVDVRDTVELALDPLRQAARAKRLRITIDSPAELDRVAADPERLRQIIWNMLSNAVKFTPEAGTIRIGLSREGHAVAITVADTGPGIEPDFLPRVFERFSQQDTSITREHGGMGLGLAIVRYLTEMHGGRVNVSSTPGEGAVFTVAIPVATPDRSSN